MSEGNDILFEAQASSSLRNAQPEEQPVQSKEQGVQSEEQGVQSKEPQPQEEQLIGQQPPLQDAQQLVEPTELGLGEIGEETPPSSELDILEQISNHAVELAEQEYRRKYGEGYDPISASSHQQAFFNLLLNKYTQSLVNAYEQQVQQMEQERMAQQTVDKVNSLAKQKFGEDVIERINSEIIPNLSVAEYRALEQKFDEAILKGDIKGALSVYEELLVKAKNNDRNEELKMINPSPAGDSVIELGSKDNDINKELMDLADF